MPVTLGRALDAACLQHVLTTPKTACQETCQFSGCSQLRQLLAHWVLCQVRQHYAACYAWHAPCPCQQQLADADRSPCCCHPAQDKQCVLCSEVWTTLPAAAAKVQADKCKAVDACVRAAGETKHECATPSRGGGADKTGQARTADDMDSCSSRKLDGKLSVGVGINATVPDISCSTDCLQQLGQQQTGQLQAANLACPLLLSLMCWGGAADLHQAAQVGQSALLALWRRKSWKCTLCCTAVVHIMTSYSKHSKCSLLLTMLLQMQCAAVHCIPARPGDHIP